jgi:serine/threonine protein kinase
MSRTISPDDDDPLALPGYELLGEAARYGLTIVYRARQRSLNRIVAVRTVQATEGGGEWAAQCIRQEAGVLARLQHPHVLSILDLVEHAGRVFLVTEFIEGGMLANKIAGQQQPARPAASLIEHLARTLAFVHQRGIIHCNMKPQNVLLAVSSTGTFGTAPPADCQELYGLPLLGDFELALDRDAAASLQEGLIRGTPAYMAPEQAQGRHGDIGPATDIYGLGTILYEMLTGRPPFQASSVLDMLTQVMDSEPVPVRNLNPDVDRVLEAICLRCLRKDPARRYPSAFDLAGELRAFIDRPASRWWF